MWDLIENYYEPRQCFDENQFSKVCEMSENQSAFLAGCFRESRPHKVLEIGTSGGASTALIHKTSDLMGLNSEIHSVDLSKSWVQDRRKISGWFCNDYIKSNASSSFLNEPTFYLGNIVGAFIEQIGDGIDFVILDSAHATPGELLDFLIILPYLTTDAFVVVHDICLGHKYAFLDTMANTMLFSCVVAEKYLNTDQLSYTHSYPNIGAFRINNDTRRLIKNVFLMLLCRWKYMPLEEHIIIARDIIKDNYDAECFRLFEEALLLNMYSNELLKKKTIKKLFINALKHEWFV